MEKWKSEKKYIDTQDKVMCNELCHDSKQRRGLENTKDIQQRNLKRRNQNFFVSSS